MGSQQSQPSKVSSPPVDQNNAAPAHLKVRFSPDLLMQLQKEQEQRLQFRRTPQLFVEEVEQDRKAKIEVEYERLRLRAHERVLAKTLEDLTSQETHRVMERVGKQVNGSPRRINNQSLDSCATQAAEILKVLENSQIESIYSALDSYERCVKNV